MVNNDKLKPYFKGWNNIEDGYYTKTTLRNDYGLKPKHDEPDAIVMALNYKGPNQEFALYHIDNTIEIKKRKIEPVELTSENIAQALYVINKSAKISRNTKKDNYYRGRHNIVSAAKKRELRLYELKNAVLDKLINGNLVKTEGYHIQKLPDFISPTYLLLLRLGKHTLHIPISHDETIKYTLLGDLDTTNSAEKTIENTLGFFKSVDLLERFIESSTANIAN